MALTAGTTYIKVEADLTPLKRDVAEAGKIASTTLGGIGKDLDKNLGSSLGKASTALSNFGSRTRVVSLGAAGALGYAAKAASDLEETVSFARVTFKGASDDILKWSESTLETMGLAKETALGAATEFGGLLQATGSTAKESATLSKELTQLAVDMSSAKNVRLEDAITALGSGLRGEAEPMRKFNVLLSEQAIKAYAVKNGIAKSNTEMTEAQKVQARLGLVMSKTKDIQGDYARTANSAANSQRRAQESAKEAAATLGQALAPILAKAANFAGKVAEKFTEMDEGQQNLVLGAGAALAAVSPLSTALGGIAKVAKGAVSGFNALSGVSAVGGPLVLGLTAVAGILGTLYYAAEESKRQIRELAKSFATGTTKVEDFLAEWEPTLASMDAAGGLLGKAADGFRDDFAASVEVAKDQLQLQLDELGKLPGALDKSTRKAIEAQIAQGHFTTALTMMTAAEEKARDRLNKRGERMEEAWHETDRLMNITERYKDMLKEKERKEKLAADAVKKHDDALADLAASAAAANRKARGVVKTLEDLIGLSNIDIAVQFRALNMPTYAKGGPPLSAGSAREMAEWATGRFPGLVITSRYRPGDDGYHGDARNPAHDIAMGGWPSDTSGVFTPAAKMIYDTLAGTFGNSIREMIYGRWQWERGREIGYSGGDHWGHIHLADRGGVFVNPSNSLGLVALGPRVTEPVTFHGATKIGEAPTPKPTQIINHFHIHGDVHEWETFKKKVSNANTENVFRLTGI